MNTTCAIFDISMDSKHLKCNKMAQKAHGCDVEIKDWIFIKFNWSIEINENQIFQDTNGTFSKATVWKFVLL